MIIFLISIVYTETSKMNKKYNLFSSFDKALSNIREDSNEVHELTIIRYIFKNTNLDRRQPNGNLDSFNQQKFGQEKESGIIQHKSLFYFNMIGPFILAKFADKKKLYINELSHDYLIFIPQFFVQKRNGNTLNFIPSNPNSLFSFCIDFKDHISACSSWYTLIQKAEEIIEGELKMITLNIPINLLDLQTKTLSKMDLTNTQNSINFTNCQYISKDFKNSLDASRLEILPANDVPEIDNDKIFMSFILNPSWQQKYAIICGSEDDMFITFVTLFGMINNKKRENRKKEFCHDEQSHTLCNDTYVDNSSVELKKLSSIKFFSKPASLRSDVSLHTGNINFGSVQVPLKASSDLELISFETNVKRHIIVDFADTKMKKLNIRQEKMIGSSLSFEERIQKMKSKTNIKDLLTNLGYVLEEKKEFEADQKKGKDIINQFLHSITSNEDISSFCEEIGFTYNKYAIRPVEGKPILQKFTLLIKDIPNEFTLNNESYLKFAECFASILIQNVDKKTFYQSFKALLSKTSFSELLILAQDGSLLRTVFNFVHRLVFQKRLFDFVIYLQNSPEWRRDNFQTASVWHSLQFFEFLASKISTFSKKKILKSDFNIENIPVNFIHIHDRYDTIIRIICETILDRYQNYLGINDLVLLLIQNICEFLYEGYQRTSTALFPEMQTPWYTMYIASTLPYEYPEMLQFSQVVNKIFLSDIKNPRNMLMNLILDGIRFGVIDKWIIFAAFAAKEIGCYKPKSSIFKNDRVVSISNSLHMISSVMIETTPTDLISIYD